MSNSFASLFRIVKDPRRKKSVFPNKLEQNILVKPKKRNFIFQKFSHYPKRKKIIEIIAFILCILSYILYYLSLGGCDGTQTECLKNSNIAYYYLLVNYCFLSSGIISLLMYLMVMREVSKYHLIHIFLVFSFLFLSDTGASLMNHGTYNIIGFLIFFIFFCAFLGCVSTIQDLLMNKTLFKKLIVINSVILVVIFSRYIIHNKFKKECIDWDLGLNNTRIEDDINKYACQIHRPISCHITYFNKKQDLSNLLKLQCSNNINSNQVINSRNLLVKYINRTELEKTKSFGFPLTNNPKFKIDNSLTPESFTKKVYDNIIDMDNPPKDLTPEQYPEITLNFQEVSEKYVEGDKSMKYMGKININITKNKNIALERKNRENSNSLFNNIIMIYTDSVSRAHFKRKMPKTCSFIEKFMKNNFENDYNDLLKNEMNKKILLNKNETNVNEAKMRNLGINKNPQKQRRKHLRKKSKQKLEQNINQIIKEDKNKLNKINILENNKKRKINKITLNKKIIMNNFIKKYHLRNRHKNLTSKEKVIQKDKMNNLMKKYYEHYKKEELKRLNNRAIKNKNERINTITNTINIKRLKINNKNLIEGINNKNNLTNILGNKTLKMKNKNIILRINNITNNLYNKAFKINTKNIIHKKINENYKNKTSLFLGKSTNLKNNDEKKKYISTSKIISKHKNRTFILTSNLTNIYNNTSLNFIYNSTYLNNSNIRSIINVKNNYINITNNNRNNPINNKKITINNNATIKNNNITYPINQNIKATKRNFNEINNSKTKNISDNYYAYQFLKYHTFTSGTKFNAMPMFFGKSVYDTVGTNIIKYFKELGYVTAQSLDMCSKEVWEPEREPSNIDFDSWDHENVAMFCDPSYMDRKSLYSIYKGVYSLLRRCFYGKEVHDYIFEYGTKFWEAYPDNRKFLRLGFNDGHESTFEVMQYLDEPMYNFLTYFYDKGYLRNTALIFVSDHGNHMPGLYNLFFSDQYETERLLGNFYIIINSDYLFHEKRKAFRQFNENIIENQQSLITPYDIYDTLIHIIYGDIYDQKYTIRGASLFMKIDNTKRDCSFFDQDDEEKGLCKCTLNANYEKFLYYKNKN